MPLRKGFTLVEIMVAMIVLSLLAAGFFGTSISGRYLVQRSKKRLAAVEVAKQEIESRRYLVSGSTWDVAGSALYPTGWTPWVSRTFQGTNYSIRYRIDENLTQGSFRRITMEVRWNDTTI